MAEEPAKDNIDGIGERTALLDTPVIVAEDANEPAEAITPNNDCPCEEIMYGAQLIACNKCDIWWHASCVGLVELKKANIVKLKTWLCPFCYQLPPKVKEKTAGPKPVINNTPKCTTTSLTMKEEFNLIVPTIRAQVEEAVTAAIKRTDKKTWAQLLSTNKEETKKAVETSMKEAVNTSQQKIIDNVLTKQDADNVERERRMKNIIIRDIPELEDDDSKKRTQHDWEHVLDILTEVTSEDNIVRVTRAGPRLGTGYNKERTTPRPVIVQMETPQVAQQLHRHGSGKKIVLEREGGKTCEFWLNQDLIKSDREAQRDARKQRYQSKDSTSAAPFQKRSG